MPKVAIFKIYSRNKDYSYCNECGDCADFLELVSKDGFEEISEEELKLLKLGIREQTNYDSPKYLLVEETKVKTVIEKFSDILAKLKARTEAELKRKAAADAAAQKRAKTIAIKKEERERKKLEALKAKYEGNND